MSRNSKLALAILILVIIIVVGFFATRKQMPAPVAPENISPVTETPASPKMPAGTPANGNVSGLTAYAWYWQRTAMTNDANTNPKPPVKFILKFGSDGHMSSSTDCNGISGTYHVDGEKLTFGPFMSTLMYCEGSQESIYTTQLTNVERYETNQDGGLTLFLKDNSGYMVFTK
ncbi:MAG: heat shock protein [Patescibacteria group bacterium]|nr:heat shock protein [Patescibacteria group bacterium]